MDRKLNRQILFDKKVAPKAEPKKEIKKEAELPQPKEESSPVIKEATKEFTPKDKSDKIKEWFASHPLFKHSSMAEQIGFDKGNWSKILNAKPPADIPEKYLALIINILKQYGFEL